MTNFIDLDLFFGVTDNQEITILKSYIYIFIDITESSYMV